MHAPVAKAAIAAGKHVVCEKPIAGTLAEAREMVEAAEGRPGQDVRLVQLPPLPGRRPGPQDGEGRGARARSATSGHSTFKTGPTSRFPWSGGSRRKGPAPGRTATSTPTSST